MYVILLITSGLLGNEHRMPEYRMQKLLRERAKMFLYTYISRLAIRNSMMSCEPSRLLYCVRRNCKIFVITCLLCIKYYDAYFLSLFRLTYMSGKHS